jgi:hypothetical protein
MTRELQRKKARGNSQDIASLRFDEPASDLKGNLHSKSLINHWHVQHIPSAISQCGISRGALNKQFKKEAQALEGFQKRHLE